MSRKIRRHFTDDFKQQIVDLHNAGMKRNELIKEYELTPSTFDKWVRQAKLTGSFKSVDNMTDEEYNNFTVQLFNGFDRVLVSNGVVLYNINYGSDNTEGMFKAINAILCKTNFLKIVVDKREAICYHIVTARE